MQDYLELIIITLLPVFELRGSIPYGILAKNMSITSVFITCVIANFLLAPALYFALDRFVHVFLRVRIIEKAYRKYVEKMQKKIHSYVEKYGIWGVAVFIAIPLPGSGVYSAALGSYAIGLGMKKFIIASALGVLGAGIIVTALTLLGGAGAGLFLKKW